MRSTRILDKRPSPPHKPGDPPPLAAWAFCNGLKAKNHDSDVAQLMFVTGQKPKVPIVMWR